MSTTNWKQSKDTSRGWMPWIGLIVMVAAGVVVGLPSSEASGPAGKVWKERPTPTPVLPHAYSPLPSLSGLIKEVKPAVVNIYTTQVIKARSRSRRQMPMFPEPFFEEFFRDQSPFRGRQDRFSMPQREYKRNSLGSGFIISPDGYLLTNHHVVANASEIKVILADERTLEAELIGSDANTDIALLKIAPKGALPFVYLGDSQALEVGDWVIAIGNPFGLGHTVTAGILSGKERVIHNGPYEDFLQTDASINPGNSGGPLFDASGNVVGINTAIVAGGSGIGFAVPINMAKDLVPQLRTTGKVTRGWLGVTIQDLTVELGGKFGVKPKSGVLVAGVTDEGPARDAGVQAGDIILSVNGQKTTETRQLTARIAAIQPGTRVRIEVLRDGKRRTIRASLGEREAGLAQGRVHTNDQEKETGLGLTLARLTASRARKLGINKDVKGLVVLEVSQSSPSSGVIRPGDVILEVNRKKVSTLQEFRRALTKGKPDDTLLRIQRREAQLFLVISSD